MCGLAGFLRIGGLSSGDARTAGALADSLVHRGPDDRGVWMDADAGIALGHRRLAVLDLSAAGHQPMMCGADRYVIVLNGEIYNHLQLRDELSQGKSPPLWRGHSDTETLLAGIHRWGVEQALCKSVGMFAFALWDRQERTLILARDRIGEKPLYYGWRGNLFMFASELKALAACPGFERDIDRDALALYMRYGYIPAPYSIYRNIVKLMPGTYLELGARDVPGRAPALKTYWSLQQAVTRGGDQPFTGGDTDAIAALEAQLMQAVQQQSIADVPLGAFLSGGIDSSTIVALMQVQSSRPVKTFTIGFAEAGYQEADYAKVVAQHLHTDHTELHVSPRDAMEVIPKLPAVYDEPFGDSSAIPTFLVSQLARRQVTVCLSGDAGDELFGGYTRYRRTEQIWGGMRRIPYFARKALSHGFGTFARYGRNSSFGWRAGRLAAHLAARESTACYQAHVAQRHDELEFVPRSTGGARYEIAAWDFALSCGPLYDAMMYVDLMTYLPDDILVKVDRAAMAVSLETRVPLLDHRLIEFVWRLPLHLKVRNGEGKWLLKQVLRRYLPEALIERPKMGFGIPVGQWIKGPLREWAEDLLSERRLQHGFLNPRMVHEQWSRHVQGVPGSSDALWQVLMFQAWLWAAPRQ